MERASAAVRQSTSSAEVEQETRHRALDRARAERARAQSALAACTENCDGLQRALAAAVEQERLATERHRASEQAVAVLNEANTRLSRHVGRFSAVLEQSLGGRRTAATYRDQLHDYLLTDSGGVAAGSASGAGGGGGDGSGPVMDVVAVRVADVVDDASGPPSFEKVSREQVEWGLGALERVVQPAVQMGKGPEYFAARDHAEGLSGERSYSGVHRWYYEPDQGIKLTRRDDGRLEVINGYHRLHAARELGISDLPAFVR